MSLTVISRPENYGSSANPIVYKFQRKDKTFTAIDSDGGRVRITSTGNISASDFVVGDSVYVETDDLAYSFTSTVYSVSVPNTVTFAETYVAVNTNGFVNLLTDRPNYKVEIELYNSSNVLLYDYTFKFTPNSQGDVLAILKVPLHNLLSAEPYDDIKPTASQRDYNKSLKFYIKYREVWTGSAESQTSDSGNQKTIIFSARQIGQDTSMADYVMTANTKKFLTKFDRYKLKRDLYFSVSFFIDPDQSAVVSNVWQWESATTVNWESNQPVELE